MVINRNKSKRITTQFRQGNKIIENPTEIANNFNNWKSRKMIHMFIKGCIVPGTEKTFVLPWVTWDGMKSTELQTHSRLLIHFTHTWLKCTISIFLKFLKRRYNNKKPWLSEGLKNSIKQKNKLYLKFKKVNSAHNDELYKSYKRKLQQLMKVAENCIIMICLLSIVMIWKNPGVL